jgi:hypothetical protein
MKMIPENSFLIQTTVASNNNCRAFRQHVFYKRPLADVYLLSTIVWQLRLLSPTPCHFSVSSFFSFEGRLRWQTDSTFVKSPRIRPNHSRLYISPARPRTQHDYHNDTKVKPKAATAVIERLMMGGRTPETCWAVNKRQNNKLKNCCIWLVIYLNNITQFNEVINYLSISNTVLLQKDGYSASRETRHFL